MLNSTYNIETTHLCAQLNVQPFKQHIFTQSCTTQSTIFQTVHLHAQLKAQSFKLYIFMHSSTYNHLNSTSSCTAQRTISQTVHFHAQLNFQPFKQYIFTVMHSPMLILSNSTSLSTAQNTIFQTVHLHAQLNVQPFKQRIFTISQTVHLHARLIAQSFKQYIFMHSSVHTLSVSLQSCTLSTHNLSNSTSPRTAQRTVFQTVHLHAQLSAHPFSQSSVTHTLNTQSFKQYIFMHSSVHTLSVSLQSCTAQHTVFQTVHLHAQLSAHPFSQSASRTACRARASSFQRGASSSPAGNNDETISGK